MSTAARIAGALLAAGLVAGAGARGEARSQGRVGSVLYATTTRLYLDAGSREGLAPGQVLRFQRAGSCRVEQVSETRATCLGSGRVGDTFQLPEPAPPRPILRPPPPASPGVLEQRRNVLASAPYPPVDYHEAAGGGGVEARRGSIDAGVRHTTWWVSGGPGAWNQERADAGIRGAPLGGGFTLDLDLSARRWSRRSDPISFRPDDPTQLYVWEASISRRSGDGGPAFSVGRVRPYRVPGQVILDGAQAGWRLEGGSEAGVFGGAVPNSVTLAPSLDHGTFGAYWIGQRVFEPDSTIRFLRHETRLAFVNTDDLGKRLEGEALVEARITRRLDAALNVRVGASAAHGLGSLDTIRLDAVRVDATARPIDSLSLTGSYRHEGGSVPELDGPGRVLLGGEARHADLSAAWEATETVRISVLSGFSTDLVTQKTRRWIGPEVALTRLFGDRGGVSLGYVQEEGWAPGRSAWLQVLARSQGVLQILTRLSWFRTSLIAPADLDELGVSTSIQAQLGPHVAFRLSTMARTVLNGQMELFGPATGRMLIADAELAGTF
jgi:hypothetical protein